jgi:predicted transcriptional regulator
MRIQEVEGLVKGLNESSAALASMASQEQSERKEYEDFVKSQAGGDWDNAAKMYAKLKKRPSTDIFGDASRQNQFMKMKFDFDKFTNADWHNYWLMAQHCDHSRDFQKNALSIIKKYLGTDHENYKYLYDRISCGTTGNQKYGTQRICNKDKQGVAESIEDNKPTIGINVRSDGSTDYASLIVDGKKKYESRKTDSLRPYVGRTVGIVRTGNGPAVAIGQVTIGEPIVVDAEKFDKLRKQHLVPQGSLFDIGANDTKYLYPMINPVRWDNEKLIKNKGIVARKIQEQSKD